MDPTGKKTASNPGDGSVSTGSHSAPKPSAGSRYRNDRPHNEPKISAAASFLGEIGSEFMYVISLGAEVLLLYI